MSNNENTSLLGVLGRLIWMMLGPMGLVLMTFLVIKTGDGWLTGADFGYFGILAAMMFARWLEFHGGNPQTAEGQPATSEHLRRYLIGVAVLGLSAWVIANIVGNYLLAS